MFKNKWTYYPDVDNMRELVNSGDNEIIRWVEKRIEKALILPLNEIKKRFDTEPDDHPIKQIGLPVSTIILCAIESFGRFLKGKGNKKRVAGKCFKAFISNYMKEFEKFKRELWDGYRNCLAHGFRITEGRVRFLDKCCYSPEDSESGVLEIDLWKFFDKFKEAVIKYFGDVKNKSDSKLKTKFISSFKSLYEFWIRYWQKKSLRH